MGIAEDLSALGQMQNLQKFLVHVFPVSVNTHSFNVWIFMDFSYFWSAIQMGVAKRWKWMHLQWNLFVRVLCTSTGLIHWLKNIYEFWKTKLHSCFLFKTNYVGYIWWKEKIRSCTTTNISRAGCSPFVDGTFRIYNFMDTDRKGLLTWKSALLFPLHAHHQPPPSLRYKSR